MSKSCRLSSNLVIVIFLLVCFVPGCSKPVTEAEAKQQLTGHFLLNTAHNCTYGPVASDELLLLENGRMEQHLKLRNGKAFDSLDERWSFTPPTNVFLNSRWDVHNDAGIPAMEAESLLVEFGKPPLIVINPDENCFYEKVQDVSGLNASR